MNTADRCLLSHSKYTSPQCLYDPFIMKKNHSDTSYCHAASEPHMNNEHKHTQTENTSYYVDDEQ